MTKILKKKFDRVKWQRAYTKANKDKIAVWGRTYYQRHRKEVLARNAIYRRANPDRVKRWYAIYRRLPKERLRAYRRGALTRNLTWLLTDNQFFTLIKECCYYCGTSPSDGVDRRTNKAGYTRSNCVPCCITCNYMKSAKSEQEFLVHVRKISDHSKSGFI